jgi:hypothetical protein
MGRFLELSGRVYGILGWGVNEPEYSCQIIYGREIDVTTCSMFLEQYETLNINHYGSSYYPRSKYRTFRFTYK